VTPINNHQQGRLQFHDFYECIGREESGLRVFLSFCKQKKLSVKDVRGLDSFRCQDIDFLVTSENGQTYSVELKSDYYHKNMRMCFETVSNIQNGNMGWLFYTRADFIAYVYPKISLMYLLPVPHLRLVHLEQRGNPNLYFSLNWKTATYDKKSGKVLYDSMFDLVPIEPLWHRVGGYKFLLKKDGVFLSDFLLFSSVYDLPTVNDMDFSSFFRQISKDAAMHLIRNNRYDEETLHDTLRGYGRA